MRYPNSLPRRDASAAASFILSPTTQSRTASGAAGPFDAAVCNFSLLGKESVDSLIGAMGGYLGAAGYLIVQTLHPLAACGDHPYQDGWRAGNWLGFGSEFRDPAPWYFRTLESWVCLLRRSGFELIECREPTALGGCRAVVSHFCRQEMRRRADYQTRSQCRPLLIVWSRR